MQQKTTDHKYSIVMEPLLSNDDVTILLNEHTLITKESKIYAQNAVTGILQPNDILHAGGAAKVTLNEGTMGIRVNNFTDQPYKLKKGLHIANFSVMTPEQMKHVRQIDPVSTWHLLNENEEDAVHYISNLLKANRKNDQYQQYWFGTPENLRDEMSHTPMDNLDVQFFQ